MSVVPFIVGVNLHLPECSFPGKVLESERSSSMEFPAADREIRSEFC